MSTPRQWIWGYLTPEHLDLAAALARRWRQNVNERHLQQTRGSHTPDEHYQKLLGAEGEIAFRVLTGRSLPSIDLMASTWHGADVDGFAVKTIGKPHFRLVFNEIDLSPDVHSLVLVLNARPRFAIIGKIDAGEALMRRHWADDLPRPTWGIRQHELDGWEQ